MSNDYLVIHNPYSGFTSEGDKAVNFNNKLYRPEPYINIKKNNDGTYNYTYKDLKTNKWFKVKNRDVKGSFDNMYRDENGRYYKRYIQYYKK